MNNVNSNPNGTLRRAIPGAGAKARFKEEMLENGSFEEWNAGQPAAWEAVKGAGAAWREAGVARTPEARSGESAVLLAPGEEDKWIGLTQKIDPEKMMVDRTLRFSAMVKAPRAEQVHVIVSFVRGGKRYSPKESYKGSGDWEEVLWLFEVPPEADPSSFRFEILRAPGSPGQVVVDDASATFVHVQLF